MVISCRTFSSLVKKRDMEEFFFAFRKALDLESVGIDGSIVRAHQHATGAKAQRKKQAIGKSVGGNTTKVHMVCDAKGNPVDFEITAGQVHDSKLGIKLLKKVKCAKNFLGDMAYDSEEIREYARSQGIRPIVPRRSNSTKSNSEFRKKLYRSRHLIENLFARLKHFRGFATRYEKLGRNFSSMIYLACACVSMDLKL
jgi:transposase